MMVLAVVVPLTRAMPINLVLEIIVAALIYSVVAIVIQRLLVDTRRMRELNLKIKDHQKTLNEMIKSKAPQEHIANKNKEMMPLLSETMKRQMKPLIVLLPLSLIVWEGIVPIVFSSAAGTYVALDGWKLGYTTFFIVSLFIIGFVMAIFIQMYDKEKALRERSTAAEKQEIGVQKQEH
jgi:uncharacterized membrane protein (DUF106 family)